MTRWTMESPAIYSDLTQFAGLKAQAQSDPKAALPEVAKQFEAIFLQMALKSMREATEAMSSELFDDQDTELYNDMFDQQLALSLSESKGIGLADIIVSQLSISENGAEPNSLTPLTFNGRLNSHPPAPIQLPTVASIVEVNEASPAGETLPQETPSLPVRFDSPTEFVQSLLPYAKEAAAHLDVHPVALLAQAALETGWGHGILRNENGETTHNLFNIKADATWQGEKAKKMAIEFKDGAAKKQVSHFRSYSSFAESFKDYINFIKQNPRYQSALKFGQEPMKFLNAIAKAGYATDPSYVHKLQNILHSKPFQALMNGLILG